MEEIKVRIYGENVEEIKKVLLAGVKDYKENLERGIYLDTDENKTAIEVDCDTIHVREVT